MKDVRAFEQQRPSQATPSSPASPAPLIQILSSRPFSRWRRIGMPSCRCFMKPANSNILPFVYSCACAVSTRFAALCWRSVTGLVCARRVFFCVVGMGLRRGVCVFCAWRRGVNERRHAAPARRTRARR